MTRQSSSLAPSLQRTRLTFKSYWQHLVSWVQEPTWSSRNDSYNILKPIQLIRYCLGMLVFSAVAALGLRPLSPLLSMPLLHPFHRFLRAHLFQSLCNLWPDLQGQCHPLSVIIPITPPQNHIHHPLTQLPDTSIYTFNNNFLATS